MYHYKSFGHKVKKNIDITLTWGDTQEKTRYSYEVYRVLKELLFITQHA